MTELIATTSPIIGALLTWFWPIVFWFMGVAVFAVIAGKILDIPAIIFDRKTKSENKYTMDSWSKAGAENMWVERERRRKVKAMNDYLNS